MRTGWRGRLINGTIPDGMFVRHHCDNLSCVNPSHLFLDENTSLEERFWSKVNKADDGSCWLWQAYRDPRGYGRIGVGSGVERAHRVAWELTNGPIPEGMCVCHHCDNPSCVNPAHLFLGAHVDNMRDMVQKGRGSFAKPGELHFRAKLTKKDVELIRQLYNDGGITKRHLADAFGVTQVHIGDIINGKSWKQ